LAHTAAEGLARQARLLGRIDTCIAELGLRCEAPDAPAPPVDTGEAPTQLNLAREGIRSVVWATGYRPDYSWLNLPVVGANGAIRQRDGATDVPGLYVLGLRFLRHRNSNFIDGVGRDAVAVVDGLQHELNRRIRRAAA
jgi:putative flavoprotein involved in K+ transport